LPEVKLRIDKSIRAQLVERDRFMESLAELDGVTAHPSDANFFLIELQKRNALEIADQLGKQGIMVRRCEGFSGLAVDRFLRIAVRQRPDNLRLETALKEAFAL